MIAHAKSAPVVSQDAAGESTLDQLLAEAPASQREIFLEMAADLERVNSSELPGRLVTEVPHAAEGDSLSDLSVSESLRGTVVVGSTS